MLLFPAFSTVVVLGRLGVSRQPCGGGVAEVAVFEAVTVAFEAAFCVLASGPLGR